MTDLGDLGVAREPEEITFGYFGARVRVKPGLTDISVMRMIRRLGGVKDLLTTLENPEDDPDALDGALKVLDDFVEALVHRDDVERFWDLSEVNGQSSEDVLDTCLQILEGVTERPTRRPSDSSGGPSRTGRNSTGDSSSAVIHRLEAKGRPDLAQFVAQASA